MTVDPKVYALAEAFVDDLFDEMSKYMPSPWLNADMSRAPLVHRAAEAIQQAIEQECEAIREELQGL